MEIGINRSTAKQLTDHFLRWIQLWHGSHPEEFQDCPVMATLNDPAFDPESSAAMRKLVVALDDTGDDVFPSFQTYLEREAPQYAPLLETQVLSNLKWTRDVDRSFAKEPLLVYLRDVGNQRQN